VGTCLTWDNLKPGSSSSVPFGTAASPPEVLAAAAKMPPLTDDQVQQVARLLTCRTRDASHARPTGE